MTKFILIIIILYSANTIVAIYKCTDTNGVVNFKDTPCDTQSNNKPVQLNPVTEAASPEQQLNRMVDKRKRSISDVIETDQSAPITAPHKSTKPNSSYNCDGRTYCSQMTSCEEATFFINNCPNTKMDGDNDGIPCEKQWC